ncbi:MAG: leucine--tRNA ligase, partial [Bdellovibrionales bacterium]|nr:leucine--tRNA ligase [Bdellovibrionales bacterium]
MASQHQETSEQSATSASRQYDHAAIEAKWQARWETEKSWVAQIDSSRKKYYVLDMFPYPSGRLHMGHVRNYTLGDVIARFRRKQGFNVLHPMGWDAFGLPAENAAIKNKLHPESWTLNNIQAMKRQLSRLGLGYDWSREITTCLPEYYRWEQLIFTQMYEKGLAYKKSSTVNWCPSCATVLANEQVEDGKCWRCESVTTTRELEQWFLRTTQYAAELLEGLDRLPGWPERVRLMQKNWIGRSDGAEVEFDTEVGEKLKVFTTRPDTLFGVTYVALAPEHPLTTKVCAGKPEQAQVMAFIEACRRQDKIARTAEDAPKEGVFTGSYVYHPLTKEKIPVYTANFVLPDYGTGALMAVPAHDTRDHAFAKKYSISIKEVIRPKVSDGAFSVQQQAFVDSGVVVHSGKFSEMDSEEAKWAITAELEKVGYGKKSVQYRLRDWGLSRQRYWGAPIPMIYCGACGTVPVPSKDLPVVLPKDVSFSGEGGSPLSKHPSFLKVSCPKCSNPNARRETDTMDTFMESSWYYLRYLSASDDQQPFSKKDAAYWLGVDQYIGGVEHATMHLLYFRFFHKVLRDLGYLPRELDRQDLDEPVRNLLNQGIVYKDGAKMSKSKGNVVEPDALIERYGADTARLFSMFAAPPEKVLEWMDQGVEGSWRFLARVWRMVENNESIISGVQTFAGTQSDLHHASVKKLRAKAHATLQKVMHDFESGYHFNTAIAAIMELVNEIYQFQVDLGVQESRAVLRESIEMV